MIDKIKYFFGYQVVNVFWVMLMYFLVFALLIYTRDFMFSSVAFFATKPNAGALSLLVFVAGIGIVFYLSNRFLKIKNWQLIIYNIIAFIISFLLYFILTLNMWLK